MIRSNKQKIFLYVIAAGIIIYFIYDIFFDANRILENEHVKLVTIIVTDVKAGFEKCDTEQITTTDENEIKEVINILQKPLLYKKLPHIGGVPIYTNDFIELKVGLLLYNDKTIEYYINSQGDMNIRKGFRTHSTNVSILGGNKTTWFEQLKGVFDSKRQSAKWVVLE